MNPKVILFCILQLGTSLVFAEAPVGLIASAQGTVQVLSAAANNEDQGTVLFEGNKYKFSPAKIGRKVSGGEVIMTGTDGKAKIIFEHGDVSVLGPSTSLVIPNIGSKVAANKNMDLMYGRVRAVIDKDGPLSGLKIKTPTAVAGVRGTDLSVAYNPAGQGTQVEVIRGEVEVKVIDKPKPVEVKTGEVAKVHVETPATEEKAAVIKSEVVRASEQDLNTVQAASTIVPEKEKTQEITAIQKQEIAVAEKSAVEIAIKDMQRYNPSAAQTIAQNDMKSTDDLNKYAVDQIREKSPEVAPPAPLSDEEIRRRGWEWTYGGYLTAVDTSQGSCSGGGCSGSIPFPGFGVGLQRNLTIFGSRFTFRPGLIANVKTGNFTQSGNSFSAYAAGFDLPLHLGYDFNNQYSVHIGPTVFFEVTAGTISCPTNQCTVYSKTTGTVELEISKILNDTWRGEVALQAETNLMNTGYNGNGPCNGYCGGGSINGTSLVIRANKYWR